MNPAPGRSITINKPVMTADGRWTTAPYILARSPKGELSDRPATGESK